MLYRGVMPLPAAKSNQVPGLVVRVLGIEGAFRRHYVEYIPDAQLLVEELRTPSARHLFDRDLREEPGVFTRL